MLTCEAKAQIDGAEEERNVPKKKAKLDKKVPHVFRATLKQPKQTNLRGKFTTSCMRLLNPDTSCWLNASLQMLKRSGFNKHLQQCISMEPRHEELRKIFDGKNEFKDTSKLRQLFINPQLRTGVNNVYNGVEALIKDISTECMETEEARELFCLRINKRVVNCTGGCKPYKMSPSYRTPYISCKLKKDETFLDCVDSRQLICGKHRSGKDTGTQELRLNLTKNNSKYVWVRAKGKLMCEGRPASGVKVKLMESDNSFLPGFLDRDDKMASGKADSNGEFNLSGSTKEITGIEPYLAVFHDCKDGITPCQRVLRINIPKSYANWGSSAEKTFNAGNLELAGKFPGETRSCFN